MDHINFNTTTSTRKRGAHLKSTERGVIEALLGEKKSLRYIASKINCSPSTVLNEIKRGTLVKKVHVAEILSIMLIVVNRNTWIIEKTAIGNTK